MNNEDKIILLGAQEIKFLVAEKQSYLLDDLLGILSVSWLKYDDISNNCLLLKGGDLSIYMFDYLGVSKSDVNKYSSLIHSLKLLINSGQFREAFYLIERSTIIGFVNKDYSKLTKEALENEAEIA